MEKGLKGSSVAEVDAERSYRKEVVNGALVVSFTVNPEAE